MFEELPARQTRKLRRQTRRLMIKLLKALSLTALLQTKVDASKRFERGGACADFAAQHSFDC